MSIVIPEGYSHYATDHAENHIGPFFYRVDSEAARIRALLEVRPQHYNGIGTVHGGVVLTLADYTLCLVAFLSERDLAGAVTINLKLDFVGAAREGDVLHGTGELVSETGRLMFGRGEICNDEGVVGVFNGCVKPYERPQDSAIQKQIT